MKRILTIVILACFINLLPAQRQTWQFNFSVDTTNVRLDTPYQLLVQTVDIPEDGFVIAKLEGECTSTKYDRMVFAVSNNKWWGTNYGSVGVTVADSNLVNNFNHGIVFKVTKGLDTFYGLVHNFVDRDGNGKISAKGRMILEFVPDKTSLHPVYYKSEVYYPMKLNEQELVRDSFLIKMDQAGRAYISLNGSVTTLPGQELVFNLRPEDPNLPKLGSVNIYSVSEHKARQFSLNRMLVLPQGNHKIYLTAQKLSGNFDSDWNALYSTFNTNVFYNNEQNAIIESVTIDTLLNQYNQTLDLASINIDIPRKGKLHVAYSGQSEISFGENLKVEAVVSGVINRNDISTNNAIAHNQDRFGYFFRDEVMDVQAGKASINLSANMNGLNQLLNPKQISANLTVKFIGDPIIGGLDQDINRLDGWTVTPNLISDYLEIKPESLNEKNYTISIINSIGQEVYRKNGLNSSSEHINTQHWSFGMYNVIIFQGSNQFIYKVIKN